MHICLPTIFLQGGALIDGPHQKYVVFTRACLHRCAGVVVSRGSLLRSTRLSVRRPLGPSGFPLFFTAPWPEVIC